MQYSLLVGNKYCAVDTHSGLKKLSKLTIVSSNNRKISWKIIKMVSSYKNLLLPYSLFYIETATFIRYKVVIYLHVDSVSDAIGHEAGILFLFFLSKLN